MTHMETYLPVKPDRQKEYVERCVKRLQGVQFDAIAFTGMSGATVAPVVAFEMGKSMIPVRKRDNAHEPNGAVVPVGNYRYVIVDDMSATGDTIRQIMRSVSDADETRYPRGSAGECVGIVYYAYEEPFFTEDKNEKFQGSTIPILW